jgi:hypothetical protein
VGHPDIRCSIVSSYSLHSLHLLSISCFNSSLKVICTNCLIIIIIIIIIRNLGIILGTIFLPSRGLYILTSSQATGSDSSCNIFPVI